MLSSRIADRIRKLHSGHRAPIEAVSAAPAPFERASVIHTPAGRHLCLTTPLEITWPKSDETIDQWQSHFQRLPQPLEFETWAVDSFVKAFPERVLALDLETCGFAGNAIFLIGTLGWTGSQLALIQHWARNYAEERSILWALSEQLQKATTLVTFNGKSFDWPQVRDRFTLHFPRGPQAIPDPVHLDILHLARRRWTKTLPNCKLQTLERYICRRQRTGDIPGARIPAAYQHYVSSGDDLFARSVLHHNALDLVTLLQLTLILSSLDGLSRGL